MSTTGDILKITYDHTHENVLKSNINFMELEWSSTQTNFECNIKINHSTMNKIKLSIFILINKPRKSLTTPH